MEVDREVLTKLLEALIEASAYWQREATLYQLLFSGACQMRGLTEEQAQNAAERARTEKYPQIEEASRSELAELLAKLPQVLEILAREREFAAILAKLPPQMRPN